MCGTSQQQENAFANETKISNLLTENFQDFAGTNKEILGNLTNSLTPIQQAGPGQFGMTPAEEAAERTSAAENLSAAGAQSSNAVRSQLAAEGGGRTLLPSGSVAEIEGELAQNTAVNEALAQSNITQKGYEEGRQNWQFATGALESAPGALENPVTQAGEAATGAAG